MLLSTTQKQISIQYENLFKKGFNSNCMVQECYLRNKGKTTPKPKKWHEALAECHFLGCGVVLPEFLK